MQLSQYGSSWVIIHILPRTFDNSFTSKDEVCVGVYHEDSYRFAVCARYKMAQPATASAPFKNGGVFHGNKS
jgi:hypothetical protein